MLKKYYNIRDSSNIAIIFWRIKIASESLVVIDEFYGKSGY